MNKYVRILSAVLVALIVSSVQVTTGEDAMSKDNFEIALMQLKKALNTHDFGLVEAYFHDDFSYGNFGCGGGCSSASSIAGMIISSYPHKVKDIKINTIESAGLDYKVLVNFILKGFGDVDQEILMTADGKFLDMEIPGVKIHTGSQKEKSGCGDSCGN